MKTGVANIRWQNHTNGSLKLLENKLDFPIA